MTWPGITPEPDYEPERPEPVLDAARLGGLLAAAVVTVGAVVTLVLAGRWTDLDALGASLGAALGALMALAAYVAPVWQARKARAKVTPLSSPRDADGTPLVADLGDGATGEPYAGQPTDVLPAQYPATSLIPGRIPYSGRPVQQPDVADHAPDGPRSEAARQAALNEPED